MQGFDDPGVFFADTLDFETTHDTGRNRQELTNRFKTFLREFDEGKYRDMLQGHYNRRQFYIDIKIEHLTHFDEQLATTLYWNPMEYLPLFEKASTEVADELNSPRDEVDGGGEDIHITLNSDQIPCSIRDLTSDDVSKLVKIRGIMIASSVITVQPTRSTIQWRFVDLQSLILQETRDSVPTGQIPRHIKMLVDWPLTEQTVDANMVTDIVTVIGIYYSCNRKPVGPYIRVVGIQLETPS